MVDPAEKEVLYVKACHVHPHGRIDRQDLAGQTPHDTGVPFQRAVILANPFEIMADIKNDRYPIHPGMESLLLLSYVTVIPASLHRSSVSSQ